VFSDRLVDDKDMESFVVILTEKLGVLFDQTFHNICPGKQPPIFGENFPPLFSSVGRIKVRNRILKSGEENLLFTSSRFVSFHPN